MRSQPEFLFDTEERARLIKTALTLHIYDGVCLSAKEVASLVNELDEVLQGIQSMQNEISRRRWNESGKNDGLADVVHAQLSQPQSKLVRFPLIARPIPSDAIQSEGVKS